MRVTSRTVHITCTLQRKSQRTVHAALLSARPRPVPENIYGGSRANLSNWPWIQVPISVPLDFPGVDPAPHDSDVPPLQLRVDNG
jgi:hypothetical protein